MSPTLNAPVPSVCGFGWLRVCRNSHPLRTVALVGGECGPITSVLRQKREPSLTLDDGGSRRGHRYSMFSGMEDDRAKACGSCGFAVTFLSVENYLKLWPTGSIGL